MTRRAALHLAWGALATAAILFGVLVAISENGSAWVWPVGLLPFPLAGALILVQRPGNLVGTVMASIGAAAGAIFAGEWTVITWYHQPWSPYLEALVTPAVAVTFWGLIALLFVFPTGHPLPGWPRRVFRATTIALLGVIPILFILQPGPLAISGDLEGVGLRDNPLGFGPPWFADLIEAAFVWCVVLPGIVGLIALVRRFRRSHGVERAQLKLFVFGGMAFLGLLVIISPLGPPEDSPYEFILAIPVITGFWALPAAMVAAVLRYRLFEIDRLVSRTVSYVVTIAVLGGIYVGLAVGLRELLPVEGDLPVAISTLVVALAFLPLARRVQRTVDRKFFRTRYDAGVVVARVAEELRRSLDLAEVTERTEAVVTEVFAPETVSIWVASDSGTAP
jgi:succinate dehydrogenase/fumarate reductase cytochrome b subunit